MAVVAPPRPAEHGGFVITQTHADVTRDVVATLSKPSRGYVLALLSATTVFLIGLLTFLILVKDGLGHAGYQPPIFWSVYITTFVFWVGIGHAGTLISAILFLFRSPWRTAVYRSTEVDDGVRGHDRGALPDHPHRAAVDLLLAAAATPTSGSSGPTSSRR